jgi:hypothetical protein
MHINLMRGQYLCLNLEYFLPNLDQWCNCGRETNTPKWPAILNINYTKSFYVTPTFCKNKNFVQIGAHIEL